MPLTDKSEKPEFGLFPAITGITNVVFDGEANRQSNLRPELDKLLTMAEELQDKCDRHFARRTTLYMMIATGAIGATAGLVYLITSIKWNGNWGDTPITALLGGLGALYGAMFSYITYNQRTRLFRQLYRDRKALLAVVDMLREIEPIIADKEEMSTLERAEIRIRLARLDVGPGQEFVVQRGP